VSSDRASHFPPVVAPDTRLLILGSLPGDASLKAAQYYAHPRNGFWPLIGGVLGEDLATLPYPVRLERLLARRVGLWDVVASAERTGSLDGAIRSPEAADLRALIATLPALRAVAFNGGTAARLGRRIIGDVDGLSLLDLPSSSPAFTQPLGWKAERWAILRSHLT
jgi:hypoxanthine-DNA glycosylase